MNKLLLPLKVIFSNRTYINIAVVVSVIVGYISYWLLTQTTTIPKFLENIKSPELGQFGYLYGITYIVTTLFITVLSGISVASAVFLYKHSKIGKGETMLANIGGLVASAFSMGCPVCGAFLFSLLGITGGLSLLPFYGLELKLLSLLFLASSLLYVILKINKLIQCEECKITYKKKPSQRLVIIPLEKVFITLLTFLFLVNQFLISQTASTMGMQTGGIMSVLGIRKASSHFIIAPKVNTDGKTTSLFEWPTISEVMANPNTGNKLADAKVVMIATGKPFYAPGDVTFDDPINAQNKWGNYETSIKLTTEQEKRYQKLIGSMMTCSYCCGGPNNVTMVKNCGCAHAKAVRGFYKYMLQSYDNKYSDDQLVGESHRWYALWYPKGMLEDYLLATGDTTTLPHETHGGAGTDGRHGL